MPQPTYPRTDPGRASRTDPDVQEFLHRFAWALTTGDGRAAATLWACPALIVGDDLVQTIMDRNELERMFLKAREQYNAWGIMDTRAEILDLDWVAENLVIVTVRCSSKSGWRKISTLSYASSVTSSVRAAGKASPGGPM